MIEVTIGWHPYRRNQLDSLAWDNDTLEYKAFEAGKIHATVIDWCLETWDKNLSETWTCILFLHTAILTPSYESIEAGKLTKWVVDDLRVVTS